MITPSTAGLPPRRFEHTWSGPAGQWAYDRWGSGGRPVVLLHGPMFDRTMWWPVAAELADHCTLYAVDLPGHGASPPRRQYRPDVMVDELAYLLFEIGCRRAPIIVGHSTSGLLATRFGTRYPVHAIVTVGQSLDVRPMVGSVVGPPHRANVRRFLGGLGLAEVPPLYQNFAAPRHDHGLLAGYLDWLAGPPDDVQWEVDSILRKVQAAHFSIFGELPWLGYPEWLRELIPTSSCVVYNRPGAFPHLAELARFTADLRALL
jgi:pimeloyl-ACP methyl ester carboxylesterase